MCNSYMIIIYTFLSLYLIISYLRPLQISVFSFCNFHFLIVDIRNIEAHLLLYIDLIISQDLLNLLISCNSFRLNDL